MQIFPDKEEVHLSQILRWYARDFGSRQDMLDFLIAHLPDDERRAYLRRRRDSCRLVYTPYDWQLNTV